MLNFIRLGRYSQSALYIQYFINLMQTLICSIIYAVFYKLRQALHMLYLIHLGRHYICCICIHIGWHYISCILYIQAGITQAVLYTHKLALYMQYFIHLDITYAILYTIRHYICCLLYTQAGITYAVFYILRQTLICCILYAVFYMLCFIDLGRHYIGCI